MANKVKVGLTYFPLEVNFFDDIKIRKLIKYQGCKSISIYTLLLCNIYQNGYYMLWDNELPFIISEKTGYEEGYIKEVILSCFSIGLFNKNMYDENKVITSKGIQDRYSLICKQSKKKAEISEFSLINSEELGNNTEGMPINTEELAQRKVKEIKEKEIVIGADAPKPTPKSIETFEKRETDFYNSIAEYKDVYPKELLRAFFDYWREPNKSKSKMKFEQEKTWELKLRLERWSNNDFNKRNNQQNGGVQNSWGNSAKKPHDTSRTQPGTRAPL